MLKASYQCFLEITLLLVFLIVTTLNTGNAQAVSNKIPAGHKQAKLNAGLLHKLKKSLSVWKKRKNQAGGFYSYTTTRSSWGGAHYETMLTVANDIIIRREYHYRNWRSKESEHWIESKPDKVGLNSGGASLKIMETLYQDCRQILSTKNKKNNHLNLEFDASGLLKNCFFSPKRCMDDCARGVFIKKINFD
ncbi:MAG: hypothetical protein GY927_17930 [bacterium]|nr:hypothetical protein [bacterium]